MVSFFSCVFCPSTNYSRTLKNTSDKLRQAPISSNWSCICSVPPMSVLFELALALFELRLKLTYRLRTPCINLNPLRPSEPPELHLNLLH